MSLKDELIKMLSGRSAEAAAAAAAAAAAGAGALECGCIKECTCGVIADADADADVLDEAFVRSLVEGIGVQLADIRTAIIGVDAAVATQSETVQLHSQLLAGLAEGEVVRTQRALSSGSWLEQLHTASRSDASPGPTEAEIAAARTVPPVPVDEGLTGWEQIQTPVQ